MNSYQRRLQEIAYLKERVAQLEAMLPPSEVRQLDQDYINKRRSLSLMNLNLRQWEINNRLRSPDGTVSGILSGKPKT